MQLVPYIGVHIMLYRYLRFEKDVHQPGAHILKSCTGRPKLADWVQGAPLILNIGMCMVSMVSVYL